MILTGSEIIKQVRSGNIVIDPFEEKFVNPNSYNYHLGPRIKIAPIDADDPDELKIWPEKDIPDEGFLLEPSRFYLGHTLEIIGSQLFVTSLIGRSSVGRLGLYVQLSADLGHLGAIHSWTLEINVVQPVKIYRGMVIGQVSFWLPDGQCVYYSGLYGKSNYPLEAQFPTT